jgi:endo-1,4-beta-xylanase
MMRTTWLVLVAVGFVTHACTHPPSPVTPPRDVRSSGEGNADTVWVNPPPPGLLPTGMTHHTYFSPSMGRDVGYCIYLPPDYSSHPQRRHPVIYDLHGIKGNELHGMFAAQILQEGILAGRWPPMILVMPNGGNATFYQDSADGKYMGETTIIRELIPHIDQTYRTIAAREGRCIEGFSMGGRGATSLALKYPGLFCSLFNIAGNVYHVSEMWEKSKPDKYPYNLLGPDKDNAIRNDPFLLLEKNLNQIQGKMRIQIFCGTQDKGHLNSVRDFHQALLKSGVDHTYLEIEGLAHDLPAMMTQYRTIWFDYHVESLRQSGGLPHATTQPIAG